jgi:hypothetical protein
MQGLQRTRCQSLSNSGSIFLGVDRLRAAVVGKLWATVAAICLWAFPLATIAQTTIPIPDGDFATAGGPNSLSSGLVAQDVVAKLGSTPWFSELKTPIGLGLNVSANITGGHAVLSTPLSLGIGSTTGFIFQNLGPAVTYQAGTYVLTTTINTTSSLTVAALVNSGVGLGFLDNATTTSRGTEVLSSQTTSSALAVSGFNGSTETLTFTFNNNSGSTIGNVGLEMFSGNTGTLSTTLLQGATFGPMSLAFTQLPEPAVTTLVGIGIIGLTALAVLRRRRFVH